MLKNEELQQLKAYIEKRSLRFSEPAILLEILDHFACKVEEIKEQHPELNLADAMSRAHAAFGVRGFAPLAEQAENSLFLKYKKASFREMRSVLCSAHVVYLLAIGLISHELIKWCNPVLHRWELFRVTDVPLLLFLIVLCALRTINGRKFRGHQLQWTTAYASSPLGLLFGNAWMYPLYFGMAGLSERYANLTPYWLPVTLMLAIFSGIVAQRLQRQAAQDVLVSRKILADLTA